MNDDNTFLSLNKELYIIIYLKIITFNTFNFSYTKLSKNMNIITNKSKKFLLINDVHKIISRLRSL